VTQSAGSDNPVRDLAVASDRLQVEGDADRRVLGDDTTVVGGAATVEADEIILRAAQRIVLEVGGNRVLLDGAGIVVEASGGSVSVTGAEEVVTDAPRVRTRGGEVEIDATTALTAKAGATASVAAAMIRLN
jgi:hypothetical protein